MSVRAHGACWANAPGITNKIDIQVSRFIDRALCPREKRAVIFAAHAVSVKVASTQFLIAGP